MRQLFQANAFSRRTPQFSRVPEGEAQAIRELLKVGFPQITATEVQRVGAFEINSNNWRIITAGGDYVLKRVDAARQSALAAQASVCYNLQQGGLVLPEFEFDGNGNLVARVDEHVFCVTRFVAGEYFGADRAQWPELLALGAKLMRCCNDQISLRDLPRRMFLTQHDAQTVEALQGGAEIGGLDQEGRELIIDTFQSAITQYRRQLAQENEGVFHIDIHPHNLICDREKIVLLTDFESIQVTYPYFSLGFGLYKCLRELLVDCSTSIHKVLSDMESECARILPEYRLGTLIEAARADLLRRALSICRELLRVGHTRWEFMLETQVAGLAEAAMLSTILST